MLYLFTEARSHYTNVWFFIYKMKGRLDIHYRKNVGELTLETNTSQKVTITILIWEVIPFNSNMFISTMQLKKRGK